jgi:endonuclease/exonuclease/phosphatase family metal-dependent hydrolase
MGAPTFTAVTYNIHSCVGLDNRYDATRVGRVIRETSPDVAGLQEVDRGYWMSRSHEQADRLAELTRMRVVEGPNLRNETGSYGNALLTRWPVTRVARLDLSVRGRERRGALEVHLDVAGIAVQCFVTHLGLRPSERWLQVETMLGLLEERSADVQIVLGDFNEWLGTGRSVRRLIRTLGPAPAPRSYPSWLPLFKLDRIWVRPRALLSSVAAVRTPDSRMASDHVPVRASVRLPALP